ncbi:hypothetical protein ACHAW6_001086 [Cyclotella cf. meneghiniana]
MTHLLWQTHPFTNGVAERAIHDITECRRKRLIHTMARWLEANSVAKGNSIPRWSPQAQLGLNLGPSLFHL